VSRTADPSTATGDLLAAQGLTRRVQVTVPHFIVALAAIADSDLIGTMPDGTVDQYADRFGLVASPVPFDPGPKSHIRLVMPRAALMDEGLVWLADRIERLMLEQAST
jgi:DNA-binding transcriptional LysR family regulator